MIYQGQAVVCRRLENPHNDIAHLIFDLKSESVNKLNALTLQELAKAVSQLQRERGIQGLLISSAKDSFIVGADITEFLGVFKKTDAEFSGWMSQVHQTFNALEDLPYPSVALIHGHALGGGCELALTATYRVLSTQAQIGLPETKLGIFPGWGGTVRLPRIIGADHAIEWIAGGQVHKAEVALKMGLAQAVVDVSQLQAAGLALLAQARSGKRDYKKAVAEKKAPLKLNPIEATMVFVGAKGYLQGMVGNFYPAPLVALEVMQKGASLTRDAALPIEQEQFIKISRTPEAHSLVSIFLGDQYLKRSAKKYAASARPIKHAAVLGAGIMGGGIAYQNATKGIPVTMRDIRSEALELGQGEALKLLGKLVERGKMDAIGLGKTISLIHPTLNAQDVASADVVVEAVVENPKVKALVLQEIEKLVPEQTVLASNTSTISISLLAQSLQHPQRFCGMHFFNPVHKMPLVEVIRGEKTSEETIATVVNYAQSIGKTPIVVGDCPGFLVNRVLFPYFGAFMLLVRDGVDFQRVDKVMEKFGWPMGPAYLLDVVGMDTCHHALAIMAQGYPDRVQVEKGNVLEVMVQHKRFGQKTNKGFYEYTQDAKGRPQKTVNPAVYELLPPLSATNKELSDEEIVVRMMLPMIFESARCLADKIVATPTDVDMGVVYGIGFPPFRGGVLRYADRVGITQLTQWSQRWQGLSPLYRMPEYMQMMEREGRGFYDL